jgi:glycosyl transferase, family 25
VAQAIPVFVINLDRRPDRRAFMASQLDAMGVAWERFPAVDGATLAEAELARRFDLRDPIIRMGRGSQACTLSHLALYGRIAAGEHPAALVLEDDMQLSPDLAAFVASAGWLPEGVGVVRFEKWAARPTRKLLGPEVGLSPAPGRAVLRLHSRIGGSGCQIVTRAAAARLASAAGRLRYPIDHLLYNVNLSPLAREVGVAMVCPALARQNWTPGNPSDIASTTAAQRKSLRARARRGWFEINRLPAQMSAFLFGGARLRPIEFVERTA